MPEELTRQERYALLQCVRCGSVNNLKPFTKSNYIPTSVRSTRHVYREKGIRWSIEFPICKNCDEKFKTYEKNRKTSLGVLSIGLVILWYGVIAFFFSLNSPLFIITMVSSFIGIILTAIGGTKYSKSKKSLDNPEKYMKVSLGLARIKPENSVNWIRFEDWANYVSQKRILQGNLDNKLLEKVIRLANSDPKERKEQRERERQREQEIQEIKLKSSIIKQREQEEYAKYLKATLVNCPNCGALINYSERSVCERCGGHFERFDDSEIIK